MSGPTTHVANSTNDKLGIEVKWENGRDPFHVIEPNNYIAVTTGNSDVIVVVRNMETGKEVAARRVDPDRSVIVACVGGQYRIYLQTYGAGLFEIDPGDK